jgi:hypothetical protein
MIYHIGLLMRDRQLDPEVDKKARAAWKDYEAGRVRLFQRRREAGVCEYHCVRRKRKK